MMPRLIGTVATVCVVLLGILSLGVAFGAAAPATLSAAGTYSKTLTGTDFHTVDSDTVVRFASGTGGGVWIHHIGFVTATYYLEAGVDLPEGAQVTEVTFYVRNCEPIGAPDVYFGYYTPATGGFAYIIPESVVPALGCGQTQTIIQTTGLPATVNNTQNRYVVGFHQGVPYQSDAYSPGSVGELLVGARVTYQVPGAFLPLIQR
jgi:hypothetical protein